MFMGPKYSVLYFKENLMQRKNQMNDRLQKMLLKKYALTKNQRYLAWLEQQSQMHISTIDSLAYDLFKRFGTDVGFGRDLSIKIWKGIESKWIQSMKDRKSCEWESQLFRFLYCYADKKILIR